MGGIGKSRDTGRPGTPVFIMALAIFIYLVPWGTCASDGETVNVRKASFAGSFYPGDKAALTKTLDACFKSAGNREKTSALVLGIIVPHAGYQYSGLVAAHGYNQIKGSHYKTVILLGSSHRAKFRGVSIDTADAWETPLGRVRVNQSAGRSLSAKCPSLKPYPSAFTREHSLEVQIPFLQTVLKDFTIVPLLTGAMEDEDFRSLSSALASLLRERPGEILIIVSSDLSHYHSYDQAREMDKATLSEIASLNTAQLADKAAKGASELCGLEAVLTFMSAARSLNAETRVLTYANSGDVTGDRARVVGYGSVVFSCPDRTGSLNKSRQAVLLGIARKSMEASVSGKALPAVNPGDPKLNELRGAFVTLTKKGSLRGCIGSISPNKPLCNVVSEMAVAASSQDPRFRPVSRDELKEIRIEISVLSPLRATTDPREIEVGTHGIYIVRSSYSGLLLPQVAVEHRWDREDFLRNTCIKAGLPPHAWKEKGTTIYTFSAQIFSE